MKKFFKIGCLSIVGLIILLAIIGILFSPSDDKNTKVESHKSTQDSTEANVSVSNPEVFVTAIALAESYQSNELAADSKYKGKLAKIGGKVDSVSKTLGSIIVYLVADEYGIATVHCTMKKSELSSASLLSKGDNVNIVGKIDGELLGTVTVSDCVIR